jgi:antitoxin component YwqK of YwqJK toxin-antitoxin module
MGDVLVESSINGNIMIRPNQTYYIDNGSRLFGYDNSIEVKFTYYPDGKIRSRWIEILGLKEGVEKDFYQSGNLEYLRHWSKGKLNGMIIQFYENGTTMWIDPRVDNLHEGVEYWFYPDGKIRMERFWHQNDLHGHMVNYDPNGQITRDLLFNHGVMV